MKPEREIQWEARLYIGQLPDFCIWRNNRGVAKYESKGKTTRVPYGLAPGASDGIAIGPGGRLCAFEFKREGEEPTAVQVLFLALVRRYGGFACVIRSLDDAKKAVERCRQGALE